MHLILPRPAVFVLSISGLLACFTLHGKAAEWNVPADFPAIQSALDAAAEGDVIRVAPGTYQEQLNFNGKNVDLIGIDGAESTIIQTGFGPPGVIIGPGGSISGFTIRKPNPGPPGSGLVVHGDGTRIIANIVENHREGAGGIGAAISMDSASPVIEGNVFRNNLSGLNIFFGVVSLRGESSPYIANNLFYNNTGRAINVLPSTTASLVVINNTIIGNETGIRVDSRGSVSNQIYRNNIIRGNDIGFQLLQFGSNANIPTWQNNLVSGNGTDYLDIANQTGTNGNIGGDPLFENAAANDFRLRGGSPAIDAGNNLLAPPVDFEGNSRPFDGNGDGVAIVDIGAYELTSGSINLIVGGGSLQECLTPQGNTVEARIIVVPEDLEISSVELFLNGTSVATTLVSQVTLPMGTHLLEAVAILPDGNELRSERTVQVVDTTAPVIDARFVDRRSGRELTSVDANGMTFVTVKINVDDACDPDPEVESMLGTEISDGAGLNIIGQHNQLQLNTDKITLKVLATDASGNVSVQTKHLLIQGKKTT